MEREEAISRISNLIGRDLRPLADGYSVTVWTAPGKKNKGWAGHVIERYLGMPLSSAQSPNFGSWELKVVPLRRKGNGLVVKETMAITMIDPYNVERTPFEESHLLIKLRRMVVVARIFESQEENRSEVYSVAAFDLNETRIVHQVRQDYEDVRQVILTQGPSALSGRMGVLVQPRTKGAGHGSTSRAFYARVAFVSHIVGIKKWGTNNEGTAP